ncbi:cupin domain-containing protein [Amycolatopsis sp. NPDC051371]|uniref:cupin domain-containing protein n=1 Tax=Amycolatopsis sp. NPDC051371 TaxID=3155800 RepID=UPI0034488C2F
MSDSDEPTLARVVVTGVATDGRSVITSDGPARPWTRRPTGTLVMDLWRADALPISVDARSTATDEVVLSPPPEGLVVRTTIFPPDSSISPEAAAAYAASMADIYGPQGGAEPAVPGMHTTETIDVMTVIEGEIWAVMEDGETLLRAGDTMVQRGTRHAWQNRSDRPVKVVTTMLPASRT